MPFPVAPIKTSKIICLRPRPRHTYDLWHWFDKVYLSDTSSLFFGEIKSASSPQPHSLMKKIQWQPQADLAKVSSPRIRSKSHFQFKRLHFLFYLEHGSRKLSLYIWVHYITLPDSMHVSQTISGGPLRKDMRKWRCRANPPSHLYTTQK